MTEQALNDAFELAPRRQGNWVKLRGVLARDRKAMFGVVVLGIFLIAAIFGRLIAPYDPNAMAFDMLLPESSAAIC
jgi:peptide/nickel transport system permease protein